LRRLVDSRKSYSLLSVHELNRIGAGTDETMLDVIGRSYGL
jgi:hypothetical protein